LLMENTMESAEMQRSRLYNSVSYNALKSQIKTHKRNRQIGKVSETINLILRHIREKAGIKVGSKSEKHSRATSLHAI
jgi:hypothetical protein